MFGFDGRTARMLCRGLAAMAGIGLAGAWATSTWAEPANAETEGVIFERQFIMQQLDEDSELLGNILAGIEPTTKLAEVTRAIADGARKSVDSFRPVLSGGRAKAEVWSDHDHFMQRMEDFARKTEEMAKAGEAGNMETVTALSVDALPCKACHDHYRTPKKAS